MNGLRRPFLFILQHGKILEKVVSKADFHECMFVFVFLRTLNVEILV